ncbi:MAG: flagellin [Phycisphaerae bacterium]|jgi:flagellin-like hook-associated protein FlgL
MASIPPNLTRVPNILSTRLGLTNINRTSVDILRVQNQLSTGRSILNTSDDIVKSATIGVLDDRLERSTQLQRNYQHATASLNVLDDLFNEASDTTLEARDIASEQANLTASPSERESQATVIDQMIRAMMSIANRQGVAGYLLGGTTTTISPVQDYLGYFRYMGEGAGLTTDLDSAASVPITLGETIIAGRTSRVTGSVDFQPRLTGDTRLGDLRGAQGLGVRLSPFEFSFNGGPRVRVELGDADTVQDVADAIESAIRDYEADAGVTVLGPGGVSISGEALNFDVATGTPAPQLNFFELGNSTVARDLGLITTPASTFTATSQSGEDLSPMLTLRTPVSALAGITGALGSIRISNAGRTAVVDLSQAQTIEDIKNTIERTNLGVKVSINEDGTGLDVVNEVAAGSTNALSISEVQGGTTATRLGIRSFSTETRISDMNAGRGVSVRDNVPDPVSGVINPSLNSDMVITLGGGQTLEIDLVPEDMVTVGSVMTALQNQINAQLNAQGLPPGSVTVGLATDGNGLTISQDTNVYGPGILSVEAKNNSQAAAQLGLIGGQWDAASATLTGSDVAKVRVESVFSYMVDLRDSLRTNNVTGITLAGEDLGNAATQLAETRGLVGSFAQRVDAAADREVSRSLLDESTRSQLRDVDYTQATSRFSALQTQLEAGLRVTATAQQLSLLDFLR